jgi:hypothetical protein
MSSTGLMAPTTAKVLGESGAHTLASPSKKCAPNAYPHCFLLPAAWKWFADGMRENLHATENEGLAVLSIIGTLGRIRTPPYSIC